MAEDENPKAPKKGFIRRSREVAAVGRIMDEIKRRSANTPRSEALNDIINDPRTPKLQREIAQKIKSGGGDISAAGIPAAAGGAGLAGKILSSGAAGAAGGGLIQTAAAPFTSWLNMLWYELPAHWVKSFNAQMQGYFSQGLDWAVEKGVKKPISWGMDRAVDAGKFGWKATLGDMATRPRDYAPKVFTAIAPTFIGILFAAYTSNLWFLFGFMSIGIVLVSPSPSDTAQEAFGIFGLRKASSGGLAYVRSLAKTSAIICFAVGLRLMGDVFNFALILVCFFGYFALKTEVNPKSPAEITESLIRFGFLGAYFIPFYIFGGIFHSVPLILITLAFFAVPPVFERGGGFMGIFKNVAAESGEMINRLIFTAAMIITLVGVWTGIWDLTGTGTLQYVFLYFWVITFIAGVSSPSVSRPVIGAIMLSASVLIFGLGPGSQDVGGALFGQWWPAIHNSVETGLKPATDLFAQLSSTFGQSFLLLTNPVGFAHEIIEGTYVNTAGAEKNGAYGVEIEEVRTTPIYVGQPFSTIVKVHNVGGFDGTGAILRIDSSFKYRTSKYDIDSFVTKMQSVASSLDTLVNKDGISDMTCPDSSFVCPDGSVKSYYHACEVDGACSSFNFDEVYAAVCKNYNLNAQPDSECGNCRFVCPDGTFKTSTSVYDSTTHKCTKCVQQCAYHTSPSVATTTTLSNDYKSNPYCNGYFTAQEMSKLTGEFSYFYDDMKTIAVDTYDSTSSEFSGIENEVKDSVYNGAKWQEIGGNLYGIFTDARDTLIYPLSDVIVSPECREQMTNNVEKRWDGLYASFKDLFGYSSTTDEVPKVAPPPTALFKGWGYIDVIRNIITIPVKMINVATEFFRVMVNALNAVHCQMGRLDNWESLQGTFTDRNGNPRSFSVKDGILNIKDDRTGQVIASYTKDKFISTLEGVEANAKRLIGLLQDRVLKLLDAVKWNDIARNVADALKRTRNIAEKLSGLFGIKEDNVLTQGNLGYTLGTQKLLGNVIQKDIRQVFFDSTGIECTIVNAPGNTGNSGLRKMYIPVNVSVIYGYKSDSTLSMDFISDKEWQRKASANELTTTKILSKMVTSPIKLSISTFDQPLRERQSFAVGFEIKSGSGANSMVDNAKIGITYPSEFGSADCRGIGTVQSVKCTKEKSDCLEWTITQVGEEGKAIWCNFEHQSINLGEAPTKTFVVEAHADYTFRKWETTNMDINFGGYCCSNKDCVQGKTCNGGSCVSGAMTLLPGETQDQALTRIRIPANAYSYATALSQGTVVLGEMADAKYKTIMTQPDTGKDKVKQYLDKYPKRTILNDLYDAVYQFAQNNNIDPAFAIAVFMVETKDGNDEGMVNCNLFGMKYESGISGMEKCSSNPDLAYFADSQQMITVFMNKIAGCISGGSKTVQQIADSSCFKHADTDPTWASRVSNYRAGFHRMAMSVCAGIDPNDVSGYYTYKTIIDDAVAKEGADVKIVPLIAAMITQESHWDANAVSPCAAAGIAQFIPSTAMGSPCNLRIEQSDGSKGYPLVPNTKACRDLGATNSQISSCHSGNLDACCTLRKKDCVDDRFDPAKAIPAMIRLLKGYGDSGGSYEAAIKAYKGGTTEDNANYYSLVSKRLANWKVCI
jgi:NAD-dependent dihydropyrimidine dehydrogenase PreA subunit